MESTISSSYQQATGVTTTRSPTLRISSILQCMSEVDIQLTEGELLEPSRHKERIREVFVQLLCYCWGCAEEDLAQLPLRVQRQQSTFHHPELYNDALVEMKFFQLLSKLMRVCGYHEFGFKDLQQPSPKRLRRQLSALINFMRYREDNNHLFHNHMEECQVQIGVLEEHLENQRELEQDLAAAKAENQARAEEKEEVDRECHEMEMDIAEQNKIQASIREESNLLKRKAKELKDKIDDLSIAMRELQEEERRLNARVVHSPEIIQLQLSDVTRQLESSRKQINDKENDIQRVQSQLRTASEVENLVLEGIQASEEVLANKIKYELESNELEVGYQRLNEVKQRLEEKIAEKEAKERQLLSLEHERKEMQTQLTSQITETETELRTAQSQLGSVERRKTEALSQAQKVRERNALLEEEIEQERKEAEEDIEKKILCYRQFEKQFREKELRFFENFQ